MSALAPLTPVRAAGHGHAGDDDVTPPVRPPKSPGIAGPADPAACKTFDSEESLRRESVRWSSLAALGLKPPTVPERDADVAPVPPAENGATATAAGPTTGAISGDGAAPPVPVDCPEPRCFIAVANFRPRHCERPRPPCSHPLTLAGAHLGVRRAN